MYVLLLYELDLMELLRYFETWYYLAYLSVYWSGRPIYLFSFNYSCVVEIQTTNFIEPFLVTFMFSMQSTLIAAVLHQSNLQRLPQ